MGKLLGVWGEKLSLRPQRKGGEQGAVLAKVKPCGERKDGKHRLSEMADGVKDATYQVGGVRC